MLNKRERWIHHYNFGVKSMPEDAPDFSLLECLKILKTKVDRYECAKLIHKKTACVRLAKIDFDAAETKAALLFQYSDSNLSDPAFANLVSGELRQEPKLDGEGVAISAHAIIYFSQDKKKPLEHLMLLEDAPGIGKSKIVPFLDQQLRSLASRSYKDVEGKERACFPVLFMDHHASQELKKDLERGQLSFMQLTRNVTIKGFDEDPYLVKTTQSINLKISRPVADPEAVDFINRMKIKYLDEGYNDLKVVIKYPQGKKQKTVKINAAREDAGESLMGKMDLIEFNDDLLQCYAEINSEIMGKMRSLIEK